MYPRKLTNFNLFIDGRSYAGVAEEVTLPPLERTMEDFRGGGMLGPIKLDMGLEALQLSFTLAEFNADVLALWGVEDASGVGARFMGAAQADNADGTVDAIEIAVRGRWQKIDPGNAKQGEAAKMSVDMPLTYYKYTLNGSVLIEIDMINGREIVNGEDRTAAIREAIGLPA